MGDGGVGAGGIPFDLCLTSGIMGSATSGHMRTSLRETHMTRKITFLQLRCGFNYFKTQCFTE